MNPNKEYVKQLADRQKRDFNFWSWLLRVVTLCAAFVVLILYLLDHNGPTDPYEESSIFEEALFGEDESDSPETKASSPNSKSKKGRPDIKIPAFRASE